MSKHLVKILSICALVILLPLTIVGVSLFVTEPVACTLTIEEAGEKGDYSTSDISIRVDGEDLEENTAKIKKHTEVTVVFTGEGYNFEGWFDGKADEIQPTDEPLSGDGETTYTFILRKSTTLTAVRNVIKYNVTYSGYLDDKTTPVSTQIAETTQTVNYGASLAGLTPVESGTTFGGWYQVASEGEVVDATGTMVAKFASENVELKPVWPNQMVITYKKGDSTLIVQRVSEENASSYTLLSAESDVVKSALSKGKEFVGWYADLEGEKLTSITYDENNLALTLYMKEQAINYTLNAQYHAVSENKVAMTYNVDAGFSAVEYENDNYRTGYTFKGYDFNGTLFAKSDADYVSAAGAKLSDKIISGEVTGTIVAVWECEYSPLYITFEAASYYEDEEGYKGYWSVYGTKDGISDVEMEEDLVLVKFVDNNEENSYDLSENIYERFIGQYTDLHVYEGNSVEFANEVMVYIGNTNVFVGCVTNGESIDFAKILKTVESNHPGMLESEGSLTIRFVFNKLAA